MITTRLTDFLQCDHPVMLAGMGGVSYADLVVAVSEAGGFGTMGAAPMSLDRMVAEIAEVKERTDKPFGVDLLTALPEQMDAQVNAIINGGASLFVAGLGVPREVLDECHRRGVLVANMCGKVRHVVAAVEAGCDIVIAQGTEAGGHTGTVATMPLVPQIVDAVGDRVPVVAAGGMFDGRGLAAALALGADGVWIGTRFIATPEAHVVGGYRDALVDESDDDTASRGPIQARPCERSATATSSTTKITPTSCCPSHDRSSARSAMVRCISAPSPTAQVSTGTRSASPPVKALAESERSFLPLRWSAPSSKTPNARSAVSTASRRSVIEPIQRRSWRIT